MRPHHHRHRTAEPRFTTYRDRRALCPAAATDGHEWIDVPELSLDVLAGFGWIARDLADPEQAESRSPELAIAAPASAARSPGERR